MKLQVLSDLHFEFFNDLSLVEGFVNSIGNDFDVLILAGDICTHENLPFCLKTFCLRFPDKPILFVCGNHEFWGTSIDKLYSNLQHLKTYPNLHIMREDIVEIQGRRFLGTTLWFREDPMNAMASRHMNDFWKIKNF